MQEDRVGQRLGRFELLRPLGAGGMGEVWLARQDGLERHVAVKIVRAASHHQSIDRLRREAQALARIRHPHVVPVHEVGEEGGLHYYVMDLVDGRSLEEVLAAGRLSCMRAAELARQIAEALAAAHDQGVVHRDVKPANVLLADGRDHVTLVDFGIAMSELAPTLTSTGDLLGTLHYMAPEQARGEAYLADARTDVWGVGVTLYEMVTGARPFDGEPAIVVRSAVLDREPIAPRHHRADCPRDLETIVLRCLEKEPERRYPSARALADDLAHLLANEPVRARRASLGYRLGKHVRRQRGAWLVGAVTAALGVLGLASSVIAGRAAQRQREAGEADELVRVARGFAERGDTGEAWSRLREVELRFPRTPAVVGAYWAMAALAGRAQGEDDVLAQEVWLDRLLDADPPAGDAARARWRLGRIYDKHGFLDDAQDLYAQAVASGALSRSELEDARFGLAWTHWLGHRADAEVGGRVVCAGDLDRDGRDEVLVHEPPHSLAVLRFNTGHFDVVQRWDLPESGPEPGASEVPRCTIADVNGDGLPDLIIIATYRCIVESLDGPVPRRVLAFESCKGLTVGDLDGDHRSELVVLGHLGRSVRLVRVAPDWSTRETVLDDLNVDETQVNALDIVDLDGDGRRELIYAGGQWTRYDVRVARLDGDVLRVIAHTQIGVVVGIGATVGSDGRRELFVVKSQEAANPRLFDDDPFLGPSGPMTLRLADGRIERTWIDPLGPPTGPGAELHLYAQGRTRLGQLFIIAHHSDEDGDPPARSPSLLHLYVGRSGGAPIRRDVRRLGATDLLGSGVVVADVDGDGQGELVFGGARVVAHGVGPTVATPRRERHASATDWLSTARQLRDAHELERALDAYRAAAAYGADPVTVAFEEGVCHAQARQWERALARLRDARNGGRHDRELWRWLLEAAEATADWQIALEAARALGDTARSAALEQLLAIRTVFVQDFADPWQPGWRVEQPLACRRASASGVLELRLFPADRGLALPLDWDGSSFEITAVVSLRDVQYAKGLRIELAHDGALVGVGEASGGGGGGALELGITIRGPEPQSTLSMFGVDWSVFPERVRLSLSYLAHVGQWQMTIDDLGGKLLRRAIIRSPSHFVAGRYMMRVTGADAWYLAASVVDIHRIEIRAAPGALRVVATAADPEPRCAEDLLAAAAQSPLDRAFVLAHAHRIDDAARELAAWRPSVIARMYPKGFELDSYHLSEWEAGLARLALLDEALASAVVEAGQLMPRRDWGVLLRRLAYQQYVDSGQTHWREGAISLRHATELAPEDPHGWYMLGYCRYRLGDLAAARSAFERAVALDPAIERRYPKQGGPAILLARIAARERDAAATVRWLEQAAQHGGNLDIARHDRALRELFGDRLPPILSN